MFSLGRGGRANDDTQGGRTDGSVTGTTTAQRRPSFESDWDNVSAPFRDDPSAPNVSARFGEQIRGNSEANDNVFNLKLEIAFHLHSHPLRVASELLPDILFKRSSSPASHFLNLGV